jgi:hypothetical protein
VAAAAARTQAPQVYWRPLPALAVAELLQRAVMRIRVLTRFLSQLLLLAWIGPRPRVQLPARVQSRTCRPEPAQQAGASVSRTRRAAEQGE